jgi:nucleoid-associated protein YgaU
VTGDARLYELVSTARRPARPTEVRPPVYRIQPGDTLSEIAARQLGDWSRWREIARLNHVDPNMLIPGETIRLPSRSAP